MKKSIISKNHSCYLCELWLDEINVRNLHKHHVFHGTANRQQADKYGCYLYLCPEHHLYGKDAVHRDNDVDLLLKKIAQANFEQIHGHEKFMEVFGKNYL